MDNSLVDLHDGWGISDDRAGLLALPAGHSPLLDGLLALLVTDLEGFTPLVERLGDVAARSVIQRHNRLLRRALRRHGGVEVAHTGDGIMAAFRSVAAALRCATEMQWALADEQARSVPLRARMGINAGEPLPEDGRLFGHCVNTAVRVCAAAHAGGILVTEVVKQLAQGQFSFATGTPHALKGISQPATLYELVWDRAAPSCTAAQ